MKSPRSFHRPLSNGSGTSLGPRLNFSKRSWLQVLTMPQLNLFPINALLNASGAGLPTIACGEFIIGVTAMATGPWDARA
jgi:hypothetical protein